MAERCRRHPKRAASASPAESVDREGEGQWSGCAATGFSDGPPAELEVQRAGVDLTVAAERHHMPPKLVFQCLVQPTRRELIGLNGAVVEIDASPETLHITNELPVPRLVDYDVT